jgi:hypothetical protein
MKAQRAAFDFGYTKSVARVSPHPLPPLPEGEGARIAEELRSATSVGLARPPRFGSAGRGNRMREEIRPAPDRLASGGDRRRLRSQHGLVTQEVGKEGPDRGLSAELGAAEPAISDELPHNALGRRAPPPQTAGPHDGWANKSHTLLSTPLVASCVDFRLAAPLPQGEGPRGEGSLLRRFPGYQTPRPMTRFT